MQFDTIGSVKEHVGTLMPNVEAWQCQGGSSKLGLGRCKVGEAPWHVCLITGFVWI